MSDPMPRASGLYGLFNLDGAPIGADDARLLGMAPPQAPIDWQIDGHDSRAPWTVSRHSEAGTTAVLVGEVADAADLAARLGLADSAPQAEIAMAALDRFGSDTPTEMIGEWSLLHRRPSGQLTLMTGGALRDRIHYAIRGARVAVASDLFRLARIGWIGNQIDEAGLLFRWGRFHIRHHAQDETMLGSVQQLRAGSCVEIRPDGSVLKSAANLFVPQPRRHATFADAVVEGEALLRHIMRERLARSPNASILLSGGLDSSLLAWLAASEGDAERRVSALTSAAPAGSGLADESAYAMVVADHLGIDCTRVVAADDADFFRPPDKILGGASGPLLSNRHCLTEAFQIAAQAAKTDMMINGTYGEMTVTAHLPFSSLAMRLRATAARLYHGLRGDGRSQPYHDPFHIQIAPHRMARLPEPIRAAMRQPRKPISYAPAPHHLFGYFPGIENGLAQANEFYAGAVRMHFPFRDMRLLRLFAGLPVKALMHGGHDRPIVRSILDQKLPDAIRLRRQGMPAEPDRYIRIQRQARTARSRIAQFRKADLDEWIDLNWLENALLRIADQGAINNDDTNRVQLTALSAEFLLWWRVRF